MNHFFDCCEVKYHLPFNFTLVSLHCTFLVKKLQIQSFGVPTANSLPHEELTTNFRNLLNVSLPQIPFHKLKYYLLWIDSFIHRLQKGFCRSGKYN